MKTKILICLIALCLFSTLSEAKPKLLTVDNKSALKGLFVKTQNCKPVLSWQEYKTNYPNQSFDVAVYYALFRSSKGTPPEIGEQVFYKENITDSKIQIDPPLKPNTRYLWSVRVRNIANQTTLSWVIHNTTRTTLLDALGGGFESYYNVWPGLQTPSSCEK